MLPYRDEMIERGITSERELYAMHCENDMVQEWHRMFIVSSRAVRAHILSEASFLERGRGLLLEFGGTL